MREEAKLDHLSVGMRTPGGVYERPIPGSRLFWVKPGEQLNKLKPLMHPVGVVDAVILINTLFRQCSAE